MDTETKYETAQDVFDKGMPTRFKADAAADVQLAYHFDIEGVGVWCVKIVKGTLNIAKACVDTADLTLKMTEADLLDLVNGREGIQLLFMTGRLRVDGDLPSALKLVRFFPA